MPVSRRFGCRRRAPVGGPTTSTASPQPAPSAHHLPSQRPAPRLHLGVQLLRLVLDARAQQSVAAAIVVVPDAARVHRAPVGARRAQRGREVSSGSGGGGTGCSALHEAQGGGRGGSTRPAGARCQAASSSQHGGALLVVVAVRVHKLDKLRGSGGWARQRMAVGRGEHAHTRAQPAAGAAQAASSGAAAVQRLIEAQRAWSIRSEHDSGRLKSSGILTTIASASN